MRLYKINKYTGKTTSNNTKIHLWEDLENVDNSSGRTLTEKQQTIWTKTNVMGVFQTQFNGWKVAKLDVKWEQNIKFVINYVSEPTVKAEPKIKARYLVADKPSRQRDEEEKPQILHLDDQTTEKEKKLYKEKTLQLKPQTEKI